MCYNAEKQDISVTLSKRRDDGELAEQQIDWKGLSLQNLTKDLAEEFGYTPSVDGLIGSVEPGSRASKAEEGNLILEADHIFVFGIEESKDVVKRNEGPNRLQMERDGQT